MNTKFWMKKFLAIIGSALMGLVLATGVYAAENVVAQVKFADPIAIVEDSPMQFGVLDVNLANTETIILAPDDGVSGSGLGLIIGGTQLAADLTITATAGPTLSILVDAILAGAGYTLTDFICKYAAEADAPCDVGGYTATAVGASATLKIGATLTGNTFAVAGNADGSFNVTVIYQ